MRHLLPLLLIGCATPALAQQVDPDPLAPTDQPADQPLETTPVAPPTATQPTPTVVAPRDWAGEFAAIRGGNWAAAQLGLATLPDGPLKPVATAEYLVAKNSPRAELPTIEALLAVAPDLPQAPQLQRLAMARGALTPPPIQTGYRLIFLGSSPRRQPARSVTGDPAADTLRAQLDPYTQANDAAGAEALLLAQGPSLTAEAQAEMGQRVAWAYYTINQDAAAKRVADQWRGAATGDWGGRAAWISGLAAWRQNDCTGAQAAFRDTARLTTDRELGAAAYYWGARAAQACRNPAAVEPLLKAAARYPDSFYGLVARETLGMPTRLSPMAIDTAGIESRPNVIRARALAAIGERGLADEMIRYEARVGNPANHGQLVALAAQLGLPGTQYWLAHNGPTGARVDAAARFPTIGWRPAGGWRIDPALALAHSRQESDFRAGVVSPAGAVGLMQVRPGTAGDIARARGGYVGASMLTDPATNLEYGQSYIEQIRAKGATQGQLLKVIAAYNAGPLPVARWSYIYDKGDPLLWIESVPYWETRYYVPSVLRNMFVYQGLTGERQPELKALAQHQWPAFPSRAGSAPAPRATAYGSSALVPVGSTQ
ncbi:lytic transglycosylase domain-containing protein [Sphingomonas sp. ASV193]|uniref:lytic transglycosylase domain-containing protein n=1 Tax=Sphingomonas sp. ASV193 TaxID=3144405 RepID=UPI0032E858D7